MSIAGGDRFPSSRLPIVGAPMAGGPTTVALSRAVAGAGGFPFLAGGYKTAEALASEIEEVRDLSSGFGVNLFVPGGGRVDPEEFAAYATELQPEADGFGIELDRVPVEDDDGFGEKLDLLVERPVPVVSLTFGLPGRDAIAALSGAGSLVFATVTSVAEARAAEEAGVDGLVVQGFAAGGHSGIHDGAALPPDLPTEDLVAEITGSTGLPLIAGGGVDGPESVRRLVDAGAEAVAIGTLFLAADEAGTSATHREALVDPGFTRTVLTRAFTGRPARGLENGFIQRHEANALVDAYPAVHHLTRPLRRAASESGDSQRLHLWAGTGYRNAPRWPAEGIVRWLSRDLEI